MPKSTGMLKESIVNNIEETPDTKEVDECEDVIPHEHRS